MAVTDPGAWTRYFGFNRMKSRYLKHIILEGFGQEAQKKISAGSVIVIGCGALGSTISNILVRSGVGKLTIVDRDRVEKGNLQRQLLFDESDIGKSKAKTAALKLRLVNSEIEIDSVAADVMNSNIEELIGGFDLVLDATDNIITRMIINDACVKNEIPWIYGGVLGTAGMSFSFLSGGPCFRCFIPEIPSSGGIPGCDTIGVLNTIPAVIGAIQSTEAMKILAAIPNEKRMIRYDLSDHFFSLIEVEKNSECECCVKHNFEFLEERKNEIVSILCDNSVQIVPPKSGQLNLEKIFESLDDSYNPELNELMVIFTVDRKDVTLYRNGRMIVKGTEDKGVAKSIYTRVLGM